MPISVRCPGCDRAYKAPDQAAGKTLRCRLCQAAIDIPAPHAAPETHGVEPTMDTPSPIYALSTLETATSGAKPTQRPLTSSGRSKPQPAKLPPLAAEEVPSWRRHLHWLLAIAMLPLAFSLLIKRDGDDLEQRIVHTLENSSPDEQIYIMSQLESAGSIDEVLAALPRGKVQGAWLGRQTMAHWLIATASAAMFLSFFMFLASDGSAEPVHVLAVGLFTATVGIALLLMVQAIASMTGGHMMVGRSIVVLIFYIFKFIAFSYSAASDPENGFFISFIGFTLGVGLCEELVKTLPLFWHRRSERGKTWRGLFIWGLASGAGFGIAEGILYSTRYYNGITGSGAYLVRFTSCVALHAIWSGCAGITLYLRRDSFNHCSVWYEWIGPTLAVLAVPMTLHGLYDTCLKRDMNGGALLVAVVSFGWLAFLTSRLYGIDDASATRAMLKEYKRRQGIVGSNS